MTLDELNDALEAMASKASEPDQMPGLITIQTDDWVSSLADLRAPCKALSDGMRYRDIVVHVGSQKTTGIISRGEASKRGEPYRDLLPRS